ncbi:hypothetical protein [Sphingobacterium sp. LRF_L2]|uniref:hypothetical protein n=1 Tax=Sphingobacterium sp. LRF_L2 TaxID=3369421 RepID=UPI003F63F22F
MEKMRSPQEPTAAQTTELEKSGKLACTETKKVTLVDGKITVPIELARQAVALVKIDW